MHPLSIVAPLDEYSHVVYSVPTMFAAIKTGGKQYLVREGEVLKIEKVSTEVGKPIEFEALLRADEDGLNVEVGAPTLAKQVTGEVVAHGRDKKISVVKYKPKVRYKKRVGHRQPFTKVKITKI